MKRAILCLALLTVATPARADINLDDIAPKLTKCWSTTCVMPDASVNAVLFNLGTKKFEAGTVALGGGLALLFMADQVYASGIVAHASGVLSQEAGKSSRALLSVGAVIARYVEVSYSRSWLEGGPGANYISLAGNLPFDFFTKATLPQRALSARAGKLTERDF